MRIVLPAVLLVLVLGCQPPATSEKPADSGAPDATTGVELEGDEAVASYGIGFQVGSQIRGRYGESVDADAFRAGIADGVEGADSRITEERKLAALRTLNSKLEQEQQSMANDNLAAGQAFLADNGKREGVVTLPSGLQYEIIREGEGESPGPSDNVTTHYHGTLIDGTVFDSSVERGEPIAFNVNGVIRGWTEALQLMQPGAQWRLFIPSDLAYGPSGRGPTIGPNSALVFDVELISVN